MSLNFLHEDTCLPLPSAYVKKQSWLEWLGLRRRRVDCPGEIAEIHDLISNVYESIDDQARAVLLSLSRVVQSEDGSVTVEQKIKALVAIGHSLSCAHTQVKNFIQLYTELFVRALDHVDPRMRLAAVIAMAEASIENLNFQMKLNEIGVIPKLFDLMRTAIPHAGRSIDDINDHTKLVAWCCYAIVHISANCVPNILLLRSLVPVELATLEEAVQIEVWNQVWRENYAQTILEFGDAEFTSSILAKAVQASPLTFDSHDDRARASSGNSHSGDVRSLTPASRERCTIT